MADIFYSRDAIQLLQGKKLYLIGDSNIRALYKDIICLLNGNRLLTEKQLKAKAEKHFLGDVLLRGSPLTKGRAYREDRRFLRDDLHVEFHFVTKCLNDDIKTMMSDFRERRITPPDIIVMNSTQWDVNRWGPRGVELFKDNMLKLMHLFKSSLPPSTLIIWVTAPPISVRIIGGYMIKQLEFAQFTMRFHVMEANTFAKELMDQFGFNCLDFHYHLQWQVHWRLPDGMHWSSRGMRFLGNLLLTHIALALGVPLPGNYHTNLLSKHKALARNRAAADAAKDIPKQANEEATSMKTSEEATKEASMKTSEEAPKAMAVRQSTAGLPSPPRVRNPRPRVAVPVRRQQQQQQQQQQQPYNHDERVFWRPRQPRREVVWDRGHSSHSMGSPMGQPMVPPMGHPMGHQMGPPMGHHMGPPMGHGLRPPRPQYAGGYFVHGGQLGGPPLPAYPAPELPPLPSGPEPGDHYANDDWGDNAGAFFTTFSEPQPPQPPQQIQSLWGPVRPVRQGHAGRRPRPY